MKTINKVIELMREGDYGIGVTNEDEVEKTLNILKDNGFEEKESLKDTLAGALKRITTGDKQGCVIELFTDLADRIVYLYTNKKDFDSDGERIAGEGILFTYIDFPNTKPKDLLRDFDIVSFKDIDLIDGIYYNGFLYTPHISMNRFDLDLVEKVVSCPSTINKIVRKNKTIWERKPSITELEIGTKVKVKLMSENIEVNGTIISSDGERLILFDNYTTSKGLEEEKDYKLIEIYE